jgi:hypothetical protein
VVQLGSMRKALWGQQVLQLQLVQSRRDMPRMAGMLLHDEPLSVLRKMKQSLGALAA